MAKYRGRLELNWVNKGDIIISKIFPKEEKARPLSFQNGEFDEEELLPRELELIKTVKRKKLDPEPENMLIWGENLIALKSIEKDFAGKIKLIYIDPPFNTGQDFEHYEDGLEHSIWLSMMNNRLELLHNLLREDGLIFIHIDDEEMAYLKVLLDKIFLRRNFVNTVCLRVSPPNSVKITHAKKKIIKEKEYLICYAKAKDKVEFIPQFISAKKWDTHFNYFIENRDKNWRYWKVDSLKEKLTELNLTPDLDNKKFMEWIIKNSDRIFQCVHLAKIKNLKKYQVNRIIPIENMNDSYAFRGRQVQFLSKSIKYLDSGLGQGLARLICDFWQDISFNNLFQEGGVVLRFGKKPERLIKRLINLCNVKNNEWVLDCFGGSGTTGAVAHKMGRRWIIIEINKLAYTHAYKRLKNVVTGKDQSGISKEVEWKGGGGFKFYKLGEPLIVKHKDYPSINIINPKYYNGALIKVICKLEGFIFKDALVIHGVNKIGNKYAHITEQYVSQAYIDYLKTCISENEELVIYCFKQDEQMNIPDNIIIKRLPNDLLKTYALTKKK